MAVIGVIVLLSASVLITVESIDPEPVCPVYIEEGQTLQCYCKAPKNITDVPPTISLSWLGTNTSSNVLEIRNVHRTSNGTRYTCQMVLNGMTTTSVHTVQVIYGPDNSTTKITGPTQFPTDGTNPVTLTCIATEVNPTPKYTWSGINCSNGNQGNTCTFSPVFPADDRKVVTCKAENPVTALPVTKTAWATFTLSLQEVTTPTTTSAPITTAAAISAAPTAVPPTIAPPTTRAPATTAPLTTTSAAPVTTFLPATTTRITTTASLTTAPVTSAPITTAAPVTSAPITTAAPVTTAQLTTDASVATTTAGQGTITKETDGSTPGTANTNATPPSGTGSSSTEGAAQVQKSKLPIGVIVGCSVGGFVLILVVFAICCTRRKSKKKHVTLKNAESKKDQTRQAYVNKGYLSLDLNNGTSRSAARKQTNSNQTPTVTGQNNEPQNEMASSKENGATTGFGYSPLSDESSHVTSSPETTRKEVTFIETPIFDTYSSVNETEPPQSNHAVTELEMSSTAGGGDYAEVNKEKTANSDVDEASEADGTDMYAVVDKSRSREPDNGETSKMDDSDQGREDEDEDAEIVGYDDLYAVVKRPSEKRKDSY